MLPHRASLSHLGALVGLSLTLLVAACGPRADSEPVVRVVGTRSAGLTAYCSAPIEGHGQVNVEEVYLPRVVACENGAADDEALRAQAVAARSYLYYKLARGSAVVDGAGDQVFTCANPPTQRHYDAVATTAGEVLRYRDTPVAAFYVAGAVPSTDDCVAAGGDNDYSNTERYVTYNWGKAGEGLEQTSLGWVNAGNYANRGCQSQNGAHCLARKGWGYEDILRFYYGMDIEHVVAEGPCVAPTGLPHSCGIVVAEGEAIYDESGACFFRGCASADSWGELPDGYGGSTLVTGATASAERDCFGRWQLSFAYGGEHTIEVHIPDIEGLVSEATYIVRHAGLDTTVVVPQASASGWVRLGTFSFDVGSFQHVELVDAAPEGASVESGALIAFDAVRVRPAGASFDDGGVRDGGDPDAGDDDGRRGDLPPSVVYVCACVTVSERVGSGGVVLLGLMALVFTRRRAPPR